MIEWFANPPWALDVDELYSRARDARRRGQGDQAAHMLCAALQQISSDEKSYQRAARLLAEEFIERKRMSEALSIAWYLADPSLQNQLLESADGDQSARTWSGQAALGLCPLSEVKKLHEAAARAFEGSGSLVHAAIEYERAERTNLARALWARLAQNLDATPAAHYSAGLAHFNAARTSLALGDADQARSFTTHAVHRLEEAADRFEAGGQRERAFDSFSVLMEVGEVSGSFEHVIEGSVNAIRILAQDHLVHHAARLFRHSIELAKKAGELSAAATLARELSAFARKNGFDALVESSLGDQAELYQAFAAARLDSGAPPSLVQNALTQSLLAHAELGQYEKVRGLYAELAELELGERQRQHYRRAAGRDYPSDRALARAPDEFGNYVTPPPVWFDDLVEWQEQGSAAACTAGVLLDPEVAQDRQTCRAALVARLAAQTAQRPSANQAHADYVVCNCLSVVGLYSILPALERYYESSDANVRRAAIEALGGHAYKRSFVSLEKAVHDPDPNVRKAAIDQMSRLRFDHAFEPLARIYRQSDHEPARLAALAAIAQIDLDEAVDLLLEAMKHGSDQERQHAIQAATRSRSPRFLNRARPLLPNAPPRLKQAIRAVSERTQTR